jgi:hypothetical protein
MAAGPPGVAAGPKEAATPALPPSPALPSGGEPGTLRVSSGHAIEVSVFGQTWSLAEARRGIPLPAGDHEVVVHCLDCAPGTAAVRQAITVRPGTPTLLPNVEFP